MDYKLALHKMITEQTDEVQYYLKTEQALIHVNELIDKTITVAFHSYQCCGCGKDKKIFAQGFCYACFMASPQAGDWIMKPELSTAHLDIEDRDLNYEKAVQLKPHIVYLALSSEIKVGVTRKTQIPTRWIDQGASEATVLLETPNRYLAGVAEVALKDYVADKTSWKKMLKNDVDPVDLLAKREEMIPHLPKEVQDYIVTDVTKYTIKYPVKKYPTKIKSTKLANNDSITGKIIGIKGQYLLFEDGTVFNVRSHEGYVVTLAF